MAEKEDKKPQGDVIVKTLFDARTIMFYGPMDQDVSQRLSESLLAMAHKSDDDITLFVNSPGGHVESGDTIFDLIQFIKPRVKIVGTGCVASIASHIYLSTDVKNRFSLSNTRYLLHQPSGGSRGQASDIEIQAEQIVKMKKRINAIISERTGQPIERVNKDVERDYWMTAEEAQDYGMVGKIISSPDELS